MTEPRQATVKVTPPLPMSAWAHGRYARLLYLLDRSLDKLTFGCARLHVYVFCAQPIGVGAFSGIRDDPHTVVQKVASDSLLTGSFPRPSKVIHERFMHGSTCYAATVRGVFAGFIWLARGAYEEDEVRCRYMLHPNHESVWDFDVYVEPRLRLGRTLGRLWRAVDTALKEQGVRWSISRISLFNPGSIQAHERLGVVHLASGAFLTLGPLQLSLFSKAPFAHLSVGPAWRPAIALTPPPPAPELHARNMRPRP